LNAFGVWLMVQAGTAVCIGLLSATHLCDTIRVSSGFTALCSYDRLLYQTQSADWARLSYSYYEHMHTWCNS